MCVNPRRHDTPCLGGECDWPLPLREMKLQVMTVREDASIRVDFINHTAKCQTAAERLDAPERVRVDVCVAPPVSQNAIHQGLALKIISELLSLALTCVLLSNMSNLSLSLATAGLFEI